MKTRMISIFVFLLAVMIYSAFSLLPTKTVAQSASCCANSGNCEAGRICCKPSEATCSSLKKGFCLVRSNCLVDP